MSVYKSSTRIKSCFVTRTLISNIEKCMIDKIRDMNQLDNEQVLANYKVEIKDSFGVESFKSVEEYLLPKLANDVREIRLSYSAYRGISLKELSVAFHSDSRYSEIDIVIDRDDSKARAKAINFSIEDIIGNQSNINFLLHWKWDFLICNIMILIGVVVWSVAFGSKNNSLSLLGLGIVCLGLLPAIFKKLNPYCVFDNNLNAHKKAVSTWLFVGLLGVIIFGGLSKLIWK